MPTSLLKPALLFSLMLGIICCSKTQDRYCIVGYIENATDEDTVTILRFTADAVFEELARSTVCNSQFRMQGVVESPELLYFRHKTSKGYNHSTFFIEEGVIEIVADTAGCHVTGTPLNDAKNLVEDSITSCITRLSEIEREYYSTTPDAARLAHLGCCGLGLQETLVAYLHNVVKENIHNPLGLYLLYVYNPIFTTRELIALTKEIPAAIIEGGNVPFYIALVRAIEERIQATINKKADSLN